MSAKYFKRTISAEYNKYIYTYAKEFDLNSCGRNIYSLSMVKTMARGLRKFITTVRIFNWEDELIKGTCKVSKLRK